MDGSRAPNSSLGKRLCLWVQRSDGKLACTSSVKVCGCSQAAKMPSFREAVVMNQPGFGGRFARPGRFSGSQDKP
jgi:hypothetical protein